MYVSLVLFKVLPKEVHQVTTQDCAKVQPMVKRGDCARIVPLNVGTTPLQPTFVLSFFVSLCLTDLFSGFTYLPQS